MGRGKELGGGIGGTDGLRGLDVGGKGGMTLERSKFFALRKTEPNRSRANKFTPP